MAFETARHAQIMQLMQEKDFWSVRELCDRLFFSEATVRRDLFKLEREGLLMRVRGGAVSNRAKNIETPLLVRKSQESTVKKRIAACAAAAVEPGDVLILDSSTTVLHMLPFLFSKKGLTIITDGLMTAVQVADKLTCNLICLGGTYNQSTASFIGRITRNAIGNNVAIKMFFSVNSIDALHGLTDQGEEIAEVKSAMLERAKKKYLLADSSKFDKHAFATVCALDTLDCIFSNQSPVFDDPKWDPFRSKFILV